MNKSLLFAALCAATPVALLLPGCSGGALPGNPFATATPRPNATATPIPAISQTSNFTLGNGQRAILRTVRNGTQITGSIQILAPLANTRVAAALTRSIKIGTFSIGGNFIPQRGYSISVFDAGVQLFSLSGLFPSATETGTYSLTTADGQTDSGTLPVIGGPTSTATPKPSATAPPVSGATVNLTFTPSSDATFASSSPLRATLTRNTQLNTFFINVITANPQASDALLLTTRVNATAGATTNLADLASSGITSGTYINNFFQNAPRFFAPQSGSVTLTALSATSATVTFRNAVLVANEGSLARGTVTINGTISGPFVTQ